MATIPVGPVQVSPGLPGGASAALNITTVGTLKAAPGICVRISVIVPGSAGNLTINDSASTGGDTTGDEIYTAAFGSLTAGQIIELDWPCGAGITVSAITTGGQFAIAFS